MWPFTTFFYFSNGWLFNLLLYHVAPTQAQSSLTAPIEWLFNATFFAGPDGPWPVINALVAWPSQTVPMFPGRNPACILISSKVCSQQGANCSNPGAGFYSKTPWVDATSNELNISTGIVPGWESTLTYPMQVDGPVRHTCERISIFARDGAEQFLDNLSTIISDGMTIQYAEGIRIPLDIGILSLIPQATLGQARAGWSGGSLIQTYTPLSYLGRNITPETPISSQSWGLHLGSARYNVNGSLFFGGYDRTRLLGTLGIFDNSVLPLTGISINSTIQAFPSTKFVPRDPNSSSSSNASLSIITEPGLPYLYLPPAICTSIASILPLNYNAGLQLYTWDLSHPSLPKLLTSLSTLQFTFTNSSGTSTTISIPLALLNLTLTPPLVPKITPYFPCRPYSPENKTGQYYLGRAFLQGAFIGQNWDSGTSFIAQAPGPNLLPPQVVTIGPSEKSLSAAINAPAWEDTWTGILSKDGMVPVPQSSPNSSASNSSHTSPPGPASATDSPKKLSVAALAGIGVSCVAVGIGATIGAGLWLLKGRNSSKDRAKLANERPEQIQSDTSWLKPELVGLGRVEMEAALALGVQEMSGIENMIHEVNGSDIVHEIAPLEICHEVEGYVEKSALQ